MELKDLGSKSKNTLTRAPLNTCVGACQIMATQLNVVPTNSDYPPLKFASSKVGMLAILK